MFKSIKLFSQFKSLQSVADKLQQIGIVQPSEQLSMVSMNGLSNLTYKVTSNELGRTVVFKWYKDTFNMFVNRKLETEIVKIEAAAGRHPNIIYSDCECRVQEYIEGIPLSDTNVTQ